MNGNIKDLTGKKFNRLLVLSDSGKRDGGSVNWLCLCDCGKIVYARGCSLKTGSTKSCGCYIREIVRIHGEARTKPRIYRIWRGIKNRCNNPGNTAYKYYGGKGITVCDEWENNYSAFKLWAVLNGYQENLTIDRIDNGRNYEPSNCQFITKSENSRKGNLERRRK